MNFINPFNQEAKKNMLKIHM